MIQNVRNLTGGGGVVDHKIYQGLNPQPTHSLVFGVHQCYENHNKKVVIRMSFK